MDAKNIGCLHFLMSPQISVLQDCLSYCLPGDCVVLVDNAVSLLMQQHLWAPNVEQATLGDQSPRSREIQVFALEADVLARGIPRDAFTAGNPPFARLIDDVGWAELLMKFPHCLSWK